MKQKEITILEHGRMGIQKSLPIILRILEKENVDLKFVLSDFIAMPKESKLQDVSVSYFFTDVFRNMNEEKFVFEPDITEIFKERLEEVLHANANFVKVETFKDDNSTNFHVIIKKPDWDLEEMIYREYGNLLEKFQTKSFSLKVTELFEKTE